MATFQHAGITTTATTANQVISSFTPTNATSWKCTTLVAYLTTYSGTESNLGTAKLQSGGTDIFESRIQNTDLDTRPGVIVLPWGNGITFDGATVVQWITTPAAATSMKWNGSFFGQG
jgi:hypothetical protein